MLPLLTQRTPVFTSFTGFVSFIFHLFLILFIFYSRPSRQAAVSPRSFIDPFPPPSILHQLLSSFLHLLWLFSLSSFCHVFMQSPDIYSDSGPLRPPLSLPLLFFVPCFFSTEAGGSMMFVTGKVWVLFQTYLDHATVALAAFMPVRGCRGCPGNPYSAQQNSDLNPETS